MTVYAYLRVSTDNKGQTTDNQKKKIKDAGFSVDKWISEDGVSGSVKALQRKAFSSMMQEAVEGDTVIVTMLDRLGRNAMDILNTVENFKKKGIKLRVMQLDGTDLTSGTGMLVLMVMSAMAQIEREAIADRVKQGIARTREEGTKFGPPFKITPDQLKVFVREAEEGYSYQDLSKRYSVPKSTIRHSIVNWGHKQDEFMVEYTARLEQHKVNRAKRAEG